LDPAQLRHPVPIRLPVRSLPQIPPQNHFTHRKSKNILRVCVIQPLLLASRAAFMTLKGLSGRRWQESA